jgi:hypothetical protein
MYAKVHLDANKIVSALQIHTVLDLSAHMPCIRSLYQIMEGDYYYFTLVNFTGYSINILFLFTKF